MEAPDSILPDHETAFRSLDQLLSSKYESYRSIVRQTGNSRGKRPVDFVRHTLEEIFPAWEVNPKEFALWVYSSNEVSPFSYVLAAFIEIKQRNWVHSAELAERAMARDQYDTFSQRVYLSALEKSSSLNLLVDDWLQDRFCGNPFLDIETRANGAVHTCCSAWMPVSIGRFDEASCEQFWNSQNAREIRRSVLDGDFSHCSRISCPKIANRTLRRRSEVKDQILREAIDSYSTVLAYKPRRVILSHDRSCNLSCPSCRLHLITANTDRTRQLDEQFDQILHPLLSEAKEIKITGSGDPFGSRHFRHVLSQLTQGSPGSRRIVLHTNAVLCDPKAWTDLRLDGHVSGVLVSVDAASEETYSVLRVGGDFLRLLDNLRFIGQLRQRRKINFFRLDFVVQKQNYREMPEFVRLARSVGADGIYFLLLRNWGTFSAEDYRDRHIASESHPDYEEFLAVLRDPELAGSDVDLGTLRRHFERATRIQRTAPGHHEVELHENDNVW